MAIEELQSGIAFNRNASAGAPATPAFAPQDPSRNRDLFAGRDTTGVPPTITAEDADQFKTELSLGQVYAAHMLMYFHGASGTEEMAVLGQLGKPDAQPEDIERMLYAVRAQHERAQAATKPRRSLWSMIGAVGLVGRAK